MNTDLQKAFIALLQRSDNYLMQLSKEVGPTHIVELYTWNAVNIHL